MTDTINDELRAPTYTELVKLVQDLRDQVRATEVNAQSTNPHLLQEEKEVCPRTIDYRLLPDLDRSIPNFTGCESSAAANNWLNTVCSLAEVNDWPFRYRLQYARTNLYDAARDWFFSEEFTTWNDFANKFRDAFIREVRMSDRWEALNSRIQQKDENIVSYFYSKLRLCKTLSLTFVDTKDYIHRLLHKHIYIYIIHIH